MNARIYSSQIAGKIKKGLETANRIMPHCDISWSLFVVLCSSPPTPHHVCKWLCQWLFYLLTYVNHVTNPKIYVNANLARRLSAPPSFPVFLSLSTISRHQGSNLMNTYTHRYLKEIIFVLWWFDDDLLEMSNYFMFVSMHMGYISITTRLFP